MPWVRSTNSFASRSRITEPGIRSTSVDERHAARYLRPSELARLTGVSTDSLRVYERRGLLPRARRSANGYREYPPEAADRVRVLRRALAIGFTLDELRRVFSVRDRGGAPCREVR